MVHISEQIQAVDKTILILELSESILLYLKEKSRKDNGNRIYKIDISVIRELYDALMGKTRNLNIVLFIQRGTYNDRFIRDYLTTQKIQDNFTLVRTRDELDFMMGCLYINSNKIVYASEYKHSLSQGLYLLMNPDPKSKNKALNHINLKEFMKLKDRSDYLKQLQRIIPYAIDLAKGTYISEPIGYANLDSKGDRNRSESGRSKSTSHKENHEENEDDSSSDSQDCDVNKNKRNGKQPYSGLGTIFEINEDDFNSDEEQNIDAANVKDESNNPETENLKKSSSEEDSKSKSSSSKHKTVEKHKKENKNKKDRKDKKNKKDKKSKDDKEKNKSNKQQEKISKKSQKDEEQDEEEKIEMPEKQETQTDTGPTLIKKSLLSTKSTRVFVPSFQKSKDKGFKVDEKGLLKITGFDDSLNLKFTNQLAELFQKISNRFKVTPKMDTTTYIKTLHNMYQQHYNKCLKQTGEFNDEVSAIIFPQILRFMWDRRFLQGKLLTQIIENDIFDIKEVEEASKIVIDCDALSKVFKEYSLKSEVEGTIVHDKKIDLPIEHKIEITKMLLINLSKSYSGLPK